MLPTDTQKNTVYAFAKERGVGAPEEFARELARHFVDDVAPVTSAQVVVEEHRWERATVDGRPHDHTFVRSGSETRTAVVTAYDGGEHVLSGLTGAGAAQVDRLGVPRLPGRRAHDAAAHPRPGTRHVADGALALRPAVPSDGYDPAYEQVRALLVARFGSVHSLALQQTLWEMGQGVLAARADIAEVRMSAPNKHHNLVDLAPFGLDNPGEVFVAADRPYGLIEVAVGRDEDEPAPEAWRDVPGFV